jgi:ribosomal protein S18 acetylase RimI-like enzyme
VSPTVENSLAVRPATASDCAAIVDLVESAYRGDSSRAGWTTEADLLGGQRTDLAEVRAILEDPASRLTVAVEDGEIQGSVVTRLEPDGAHIGMLAVRPPLQARGIGRRLLEAAERIAATELGSDRAILFVIACRRELIAWYERRGYRDSGTRAAFPYGNPRVGAPRVPDLEFAVLVKALVPAG